MRKLFTLLLCAALVAFGTKASAINHSYINYQNYHGDCPNCHNSPCNCNGAEPYYAPPPICNQPPCGPCDTCAPMCGVNCGVTVCAIGVAILAVVGAAAIVLASGKSENIH